MTLCSMASFQDSRVSSYQDVSILDFTGAKDDGSDGDSPIYKTRKSSSLIITTNKPTPSFFTGWMPFLSWN